MRGCPFPSRRALGAHGPCLVAAGVALITLAGCQSGIGPDPERPRATIRAYETQVSDLERRMGDQQATLIALSPPPASPTALPFATRWEVRVGGDPELRSTVGLREGLTPVAAEGAFLVVPIVVTNRTDVPVAFNPAQLIEVRDGQGRDYSLDTRATGAAYLLDFGYEPSFAPRQPGIRYPDVLVFDVPADATNFTLAAADGSFSIPLSPAPFGTPES